MTNGSRIALGPWLACLSLLIPSIAAANWPTDPSVNLSVCSVPRGQYNPVVASDGAGGAVIAWEDVRTGTGYDIYAQHVLASGIADPAWPVNGVPVCVAANGQYRPAIVSDGSGGVIVAWQDFRSGTSYDIYALRLLPTGAADPDWPAGGRLVCGATGDQQGALVVADGQGGVLVVWEDFRAGNWDLYATRVSASGHVDPAWPFDGAAVTSAAGHQRFPRAIPDESGGLIAAWNDTHGGFALRAVRLTGTGTVAVGWEPGGTLVSGFATDQSVAMMVSDGANGAIFTWEDARGGINAHDIYAVRLTSSGLPAAGWAVGGQPVCTASNLQVNPKLTSDGAAGAIITWYDNRNGVDQNIFAQRITGDGDPGVGWPADGLPVCTAPGRQAAPLIAPDGLGGAVLVWYDERSGGETDLYSQRIAGSGLIAPSWPVNGIAVSTAPSSQQHIAVLHDGAGGTIVAWEDERNGNSDIFAQRFNALGQLSTGPVVGTVAGSVTLSCADSPGQGTGITVDLYSVGSGDLVATAISGASGEFAFADVPAGDYTVDAVVPLGFVKDSDHILTVTPGTQISVELLLTCAPVIGTPRSVGFWKHQVGVATGGKGHAQVGAADLCGYLDLIAAHFNDNEVNPVIIYQPPNSAECAAKLQVARELLNLSGSAAMLARARQQLMALLMNVAAGFVHQLQVATADGATVSQVITYCDLLVDDPAGDHELAKYLAETINTGQLVASGAVPLTTPIVIYRLREAPLGTDRLQVQLRGPNPSGPHPSFGITAPAEGVVSVALVDLAGRMARSESLEFGAGEMRVLDFGRLPAGVYFLSVSQARQRAVKRLVVLP